MKRIDCYQNVIKELAILNKRKELLLIYENDIKDEKNNIDKMITILNKTRKRMEEDIKELKGVEYKLYNEIVFNGINVTKAIEKVSFDEYLDISTLWKNYYPSVKEKINELEEFNKIVIKL